MSPAVFLELYGIFLLALLAAAVCAGVKCFAEAARSRRLSTQKRVRLIFVYMVGATFLFDVLLYHFLKHELESDSPFIFLPVAAFTVWMGYAMLELGFWVRRENAGRTAQLKSIAGPFAIGALCFGGLTIASIAYVVFCL